MTGTHKRKLEAALLAAIIGILAFVLLGEFAPLREEFEEAAVRSETESIRVDLLDRLAHREAFGGALPQSNNPLLWIARQPSAYRGELDAPPLETGVWYFDRQRDELVYRFRSQREARLRLVRGGEAAGVAGNLAGIALRRVDAASEAH